MRTRGDFAGIGINAQLWFGHGPPIPGTLVPILAAAIVLLGGGLWFLVGPRLGGRRRAATANVPGADVRQPERVAARNGGDELDRLERLAALHDRGALSDEEFETEKARVIGD